MPSAAAYAVDQRAAGRGVVLDHAAVRTVAWPAGALPPGIEQVTRILRPLGYERHATYPLTRLRMTGHAYAHVDRPEVVPQWFVSELHPDTFSPAFQDAVTRVLDGSTDPLDAATRDRLDRLEADRAAARGRCRRPGRRPAPRLRPPAPAAHRPGPRRAAGRVGRDGLDRHRGHHLQPLHRPGRRRVRGGRRPSASGVGPIKDSRRGVDVGPGAPDRPPGHHGRAGRCRTLEGDVVEREVPGSFFEVISRDPLPEGGLDLAFDAANATGIFAMTRPADAGEPGAP